MASSDELKRIAFEEIDSRSDEIINITKTILNNPEPGFREINTAKLVSEKLGTLGIPFRAGLAITGIRADLLCGNPGPTMAILGELDSLIVNEHPFANPSTGAAHACGHHCQIGMLLGAAMALNQPKILESLSGRIALIAVPA